MKDARTKVASVIEFSIFGMGFGNMIENISNIHYLGNYQKDEIINNPDTMDVDVFFISIREDITPDDFLFKNLKNHRNKPRIAIFLNSVVRDNVKQLMDAGVNALLLKTIEQMELEYAIKIMMSSGLFVSQEISSQMVNSMIDEQQNNMSEKIRKYNLTPRELQVMSMVFQEFSNQEIAMRLKISTRTVEAHRTNILNKTGIKNSVGLAKFVIDNKLDKQPDFMKYIK